MSDSVSESAENDMATELFEMCISFGDDNLEVMPLNFPLASVLNNLNYVSEPDRCS